jgi:hypothetical protein
VCPAGANRPKINQIEIGEEGRSSSASAQCSLTVLVGDPDGEDGGAPAGDDHGELAPPQLVEPQGLLPLLPRLRAAIPDRQQDDGNAQQQGALASRHSRSIGRSNGSASSYPTRKQSLLQLDALAVRCDFVFIEDDLAEPL